MLYKEKVLDRIEQSFVVMKDNFIKLLLPVAIFNIIIYYILQYIGLYFASFANFDNIYSIENYYLLIGFTFAIVIYLIFQIGIIIGLYKTISDISNERECDIKSNYKYGFLNIIESFKTYLYIFMYVYFIPSLIFILLGSLFVYILYSGNIALLKDYFASKSPNFLILFGIIISFLVLIIFVAYRGLRTSFSLVSAIDKNSYSRENFIKSINSTNGNWWRIYGNFLLIGIIIALLSGIINGVFSINSISETIKNNATNNSGSMDFREILKQYKESSEVSVGIIQEFIGRILDSLAMVFMSIFTYIFFKRLEFEGENLEEKKEEIISL